MNLQEHKTFPKKVVDPQIQRNVRRNQSFEKL